MKNHLRGERSVPHNGRMHRAPDESPLYEYLLILFNGKWTVILTLILVVGITVVYTVTTKPVYEASSLVLIDTKGNERGMAIFDISGTANANKITNELEILRSNANAEAVAQALIAKANLGGTNSPMLNVIRAEKESLSRDSLATPSIIAERLSRIVNFTPIRETDIIRITVRSTDPNEAVLIANVYTETYATRNLNASRQRSQALREFLQSQLQTKRTVLDTTERVLQNYMKVSGIVSLDAEANKLVAQLSQLEAQRDGMEVEKSSRQKILASYKEQFTLQEPNAAKAIGESNDSYIRLLQDQLAKLQVQRDIVIAQNPSMVSEKLYSEKLIEIDNQIQSLQKRLTQRTSVYLNSLLPGGQDPVAGNASFLAQIKQKIIEQQIELSALDSRDNALNSVIEEYEQKFNTIPQKSIELAKLQRARLSSEKLYLLIEEKYNEAAIKEKSEFGYVNIVDRAIVSYQKVSPKPLQNVVIGFMIGLALGIGIVFVREFSNLRIRTPEDLKKYGFTPLSAVSRMENEVKKIRKELEINDVYRSFDPHLITLHRRLAPISESYRHLRTIIKNMQTDIPLQCIAVTSTNPKEGKSTTIANLAVSLSQGEDRVLLIDADMRRSVIHELFGLSNVVGLSEYLNGTIEIDSIIQNDVQSNLDIITSGAIPPNPAEILGSKKMKEFIAEMKKRYSMILFDAPPLLAVTDASVLAKEIDGVIIVAEAGEVRVNSLAYVIDFLTSIGSTVFGVVLNKYAVSSFYGKNHSGYHYGYYGYETGYYDTYHTNGRGKGIMTRLMKRNSREG